MPPPIHIPAFSVGTQLVKHPTEDRLISIYVTYDVATGAIRSRFINDGGTITTPHRGTTVILPFPEFAQTLAGLLYWFHSESVGILQHQNSPSEYVVRATDTTVSLTGVTFGQPFGLSWEKTTDLVTLPPRVSFEQPSTAFAAYLHHLSRFVDLVRERI